MNELVTLLHSLVAIDSVNPDLVPGGAGEGAVARFIERWANDNGLEVIVQEARPGRPNVVMIARGGGGGQALMLNGHTDVVGVSGMRSPFEPSVEDGRLFGRGSYDMKGGIAAGLLAVKRAKALGLRGDVAVSCVADEEVASFGSQAIVDELKAARPRWRADAVIVMEPTELELILAHKGFVWLDVATRGKAAHGSRPQLGMDAIVKMGAVLTELERLDLQLRANPTHPYLGSGSAHASLISGGQEMSSYPAECKLSIERRTIPGEDAAFVRAEVQHILDGLALRDSAFDATLTTGLTREPFGIADDAPFVQLLSRHAERVIGKTPRRAGVGFWADSALFSSAGIPTLLFGPHGEGAHADVEWVDLKSVEQCCEIYTDVAAEMCA